MMEMIMWYGMMIVAFGIGYLYRTCQLKAMDKSVKESKEELKRIMEEIEFYDSLLCEGGEKE